MWTDVELSVSQIGVELSVSRKSSVELSVSYRVVWSSVYQGRVVWSSVYHIELCGAQCMKEEWC